MSDLKFRGRYPETSIPLAAGVVVSTPIPTGGGTHTTITVHNTGANPITAISYAIVALARTGEFITVAGVPLAMGAAKTISIIDQPCSAVLLRLTSAGGATAEVEAVSQG